MRRQATIHQRVYRQISQHSGFQLPLYLFLVFVLIIIPVLTILPIPQARAEACQTTSNLNRFKVNDANNNGLAEGELVSCSGSTVQVKIVNKQNYWVKAKVLQTYGDTTYRFIGGWANSGFIPPLGVADYEITFHPSQISTITFDLDADDWEPLLATFTHRIIDLLLGGATIQDASKLKEAFEFLLTRVQNINSLIKALQAIGRGDYDDFRENVLDILDTDLEVIAVIAKAFGKDFSAGHWDDILGELAQFQLLFDLWELITDIHEIYQFPKGTLIFESFPAMTNQAPPTTPPQSTGVDKSKYLYDINFQDGSKVSPGQTLTKKWRMKNIGTSSWGSGYQLCFRSGYQLGSSVCTAISTTSPGQETDINLLLNIPANLRPGTYRGDYQLRNPAGTFFGDPIWFILRIEGSPVAPTPTPTIPPPSPVVNNNCDGSSGVYVYEAPNFTGACQKFTSDSPNSNGWIIRNDSAWSIKVVGGPYVAILYADNDYKGRFAVVTNNDDGLYDTYLGANQMSSIRIARDLDDQKFSTCDGGEGVYIYEHDSFNGGCHKHITSSPRWGGHYRIGDNLATSIRVIGSFKATLYDLPDYQGISSAFVYDVSQLGFYAIGSDKMSSIKVEPRGNRFERPSNLVVIPKPSEQLSTAMVKLEWTDNSEIEDRTDIELLNTQTGAWQPIASVDFDQNAFYHKNLAFGYTYHYRVRAFSATKGYSEYSEASFATTLPDCAPANLTATPLSSNQIKLDWSNKCRNSDKIRIDLKNNITGEWPEILILDSNITSYIHENLASNYMYSYRMRNYSFVVGYSNYSQEISVTTRPITTPTIAPTATPTRTATPTPSNNGIELLTQPWHLTGNNGAAEKYQSINPNVLQGKNMVRITYDLHGLQALGGDASAIIFDQAGSWRYISLANYGQNGKNGLQVVEIPLSHFTGLNPSVSVGTLHTRFWYSGSFSVDITSIVVFSSSGSSTPTPTAVVTPTPTPTQTITPTPSSNGIELLAQPWHLIGNNGAIEKYQTINPDILKGKTKLRITYDLHGLVALGGDASAIIFDQAGSWCYISLANYGQNGKNGVQVVEIPLSAFTGLDTSKPVGTLHTRFWYSGSFTVDITSIVVL
jgi:Ig-like domain from next to BRCA1 gene/Beta/Gamma crystallin